MTARDATDRELDVFLDGLIDGGRFDEVLAGQEPDRGEVAASEGAVSARVFAELGGGGVAGGDLVRRRRSTRRWMLSMTSVAAGVVVFAVVVGVLRGRGDEVDVAVGPASTSARPTVPTTAPATSSPAPFIASPLVVTKDPTVPEPPTTVPLSEVPAGGIACATATGNLTFTPGVTGTPTHQEVTGSVALSDCSIESGPTQLWGLMTLTGGLPNATIMVLAQPDGTSVGSLTGNVKWSDSTTSDVRIEIVTDGSGSATTGRLVSTVTSGKFAGLAQHPSVLRLIPMNDPATTTPDNAIGTIVGEQVSSPRFALGGSG